MKPFLYGVQFILRGALRTSTPGYARVIRAVEPRLGRYYFYGSIAAVT